MLHEAKGLELSRRGRADPRRHAGRALRDLRDVDARVERNGDVNYRWRDDGEAFGDRGPEIAFRDTSDASIAAGLELARSKWGNEVINSRQRRLQRSCLAPRRRTRDAR